MTGYRGVPLIRGLIPFFICVMVILPSGGAGALSTSGFLRAMLLWALPF